MSGGKASRDKGARGERAVVTYLTTHGYPMARRSLPGHADDRGDITGITDRDGDAWTVEVKNHKAPTRADIARWARIAAEKAPLWVLVVKVPGVPDRRAGEWDAWLPWDQLVALVAAEPVHAPGAGWSPGAGWLRLRAAQDRAAGVADDLARVSLAVWCALTAPDADEAAA